MENLKNSKWPDYGLCWGEKKRREEDEEEKGTLQTARRNRITEIHTSSPQSKKCPGEKKRINWIGRGERWGTRSLNKKKELGERNNRRCPGDGLQEKEATKKGKGRPSANENS